MKAETEMHVFGLDSAEKTKYFYASIFCVKKNKGMVTVVIQKALKRWTR